MSPYNVTTSYTEARSRREILVQLERWERDDKGDVLIIGDYDFPVPQDIGGTEAILRFELRGQRITIACKSQSTYRQNLRCVGFAIEAMRMNEKRGIADTLAKAYMQLPAAKVKRDPYEVLGVRKDTPIDDIKDMYKIKAKRLHTDKGGNDEAMAELNEAWEEIQKEYAGEGT